MAARLARRYIWELGLVAMTMVWGVTFVTVKASVDAYPTFAFLGWRFLVATVATAVLFPKALRRFDRRTLVVGVVAGLALASGYAFQTLGLHLLEHNAASRAGFITGMFVVFTPLLQTVVLRHAPRLLTLAGAGLGTAGLVLLSADAPLGWSMPDSLVLVCAFSYAVHLIVLGGWGRGLDVAALNLLQLAVTAAACATLSVAFEHAAPVPAGWELWGNLALTGIVASAVAFWIQNSALQVLSPTRVAVILISEPAFAGLFGFALLGERLGLAGWSGCALILAGMLVSEVLGPWFASRTDRLTLSEEVALEDAEETGPAARLEPQAGDA